MNALAHDALNTLDDTLGDLDALRDMLVRLAAMPDVAIPGPDVVIAAPETATDFFAEGEIGEGRFYDWLRGNKLIGLDNRISKDEFEGCSRIIYAFGCVGAPVSYVAYALATTYHETSGTMQPIPEKGGNSYFTRLYDIKGRDPARARRHGNTVAGDGIRYRGRGYVQLTWKVNYQRATQKLRALGYNVDLVADPDRALEPEIAAVILVYGMIEGWFTGRKLGDDLPAVGPASILQFTKSRDIINGVDKDDVIAVYANDWQTALQHGGYRPLTALAA